MTLAKRLKAMGNPRYQNDGIRKTSGPGFAVTLHEDKVDEPIGWKRARVVFVNSMSDLFHSDIPDDFVAKVFVTMALTAQHTYQVLTKRPRRMAHLLATEEFEQLMARELVDQGRSSFEYDWPLPNVWLGTSVENQEWADKRIPLLLEAPAAVRFLSCEPLLGSVDLTDYLDTEGALHWVIVGGESGPGYRPMQLEWARSLKDQCKEAGVPYFFKQWGGRTPKAGGRELDGRTYDEMPGRSDVA
jgi:protein gp37